MLDSTYSETHLEDAHLRASWNGHLTRLHLDHLFGTSDLEDGYDLEAWSAGSAACPRQTRTGQREICVAACALGCNEITQIRAVHVSTCKDTQDTQCTRVYHYVTIFSTHAVFVIPTAGSTQIVPTTDWGGFRLEMAIVHNEYCTDDYSALHTTKFSARCLK